MSVSLCWIATVRMPFIKSGVVVDSYGSFVVEVSHYVFAHVVADGVGATDNSGQKKLRAYR
ncbi:hypothetical protein [Streptomyces sp. NPDC099088]|uniref:hypothetical protein n=1 Tax=Streptomyces sp. NPDC099088 TaxID=3366101 RepID=UPI0037FDC92D